MRPGVVPTMLLLAACSGATVPSVTSLPPALTAAPPSTLPAAAITEAPVEDRCFPDGPPPEQFVTAGVVGTTGGPGGDARLLAEIRVDAELQGGSATRCQRIAVDLATADGAPATAVGVVEVELLARLGVLRLRFPPSVVETAIADVTLPGELAGRAFVIRDDDGLTVDVHLGAEVAAAVVPSRNRVMVDVRRAGELPAGVAVAGPDAALLEPSAAVDDYPLRVSGYGRSPSGELTVTVVGSDAEVSQTVAVPSYPWGWFDVLFTEGPTGTVEVVAGGARRPLLVG